MTTVVYLSNNIIRVVVGDRAVGRAVIKKEVLTVIPEGSLINGVITDAEELAGELSRFWDQYNLPRKGVHIVVRSSTFVVKQFRLPKVGKRKLEAMIPMEFAAVDRYEDPVYDYAKLPGGEMKATQEVMGLMADRQFVEGYIKLFGKLGIEVSGFANSLGAAVKALHSLPQLEAETCIVQIVDGHNLESLLWVDGRSAQSTNQRIIAEPQSQAFATEILQHTSTMLQFYQSLKLEQQLEDVFVCGVSRKVIGELRELEQGYATGLEIAPLEIKAENADDREAEKISDYIYAYGMLIQNGKDINLLPMLKKKPNQNVRLKAGFRILTPVLTVLAVGFLLTVVAGGTYLIKKSKLDSLNTYLEDQKNIQVAGEANALEENISVNQAINNDTAAVDRMLASYPLLNRKVAEQITACSNADIASLLTSYKAEEGSVVLKVAAKRETIINQYVAALYETGLFADVKYNGYSYNDGDDEYTLEITCYLMPEAGR